MARGMQSAQQIERQNAANDNQRSRDEIALPSGIVETTDVLQLWATAMGELVTI